MSNKGGWWGLALGAGLLLSGAASAGTYDPGQYNMPVGVNDISRTVFDLHMLIFWICVGIAVLVFGVMFYSVFAHRRSRHPKPADFHESTSIEIIWTIIPFAILVLMAIPAAGTLIRMEDMRGAQMSIKVTGYQWKWHYDYIGQGVSFFSTLHADSNHARQLGSDLDPNQVPNYLLEVDNRLVVPTNTKIKFQLTSNDVIHAWWVPDFAVKKDAVPGFINEIWATVDEPGIYRGVCAELCGRDHGFMPIVVEAVPPTVYQQWLAARKAGQPTQIGHGPAPRHVAAMTSPTAGARPTESSAAPGGTQAPVAAGPVAPESRQTAAGPAAATPEALRAQGEKVYNTQCAACHQANGKGLPPSFPSLHSSPLVNGPPAAHIQQTLKGKNLMPPFAHLSDADIAAALSYERTSWGNKGGAIQAADVAAARKAPSDAPVPGNP